MKRQLLQFIALSAFLIIPFLGVEAINYNTGTYGSCQYSSCSLTVTSNGTVSLPVSPNGSGVCTTQSDTVSVQTYNSNGYTLTVADNTTNTSLTNGAASIPTATGTLASPIALTTNKWGYRVDGVGGFGAGPTTAQTNVAINSTTYAGMPASNVSADTIANTSVAANPAVNTTVWYSVCADNSVTPGTYSTLVRYTAVTN